MHCPSDVIKYLERIVNSYFWNLAVGLPSAVCAVFFLLLDFFQEEKLLIEDNTDVIRRCLNRAPDTLYSSFISFQV